MNFIKESIDQLNELEYTLSQGISTIQFWPGFSGELAALVTWLLQDMKASSSSTEFDKAIWRKTMQRLSQENAGVPYSSPELHLKIHHWVVGACWSKELPASAIVFPLKSLAFGSDQAAIAYNGLIEQIQSLEALALGDEPGVDSEMALSSVPIRVLGLAEALNPEIPSDSLKAIQVQISKLGGDLKGETKSEVAMKWNSSTLQRLVLDRHSIAHVSRDSNRPFVATVSGLDRAQAHMLGELASTLMSAEIQVRVNALSEAKAKHWLQQFQFELEDHNRLVPLRVGRFREVVTPLG
jgi:hypothetical protein